MTDATAINPPMPGRAKLRVRVIRDGAETGRRQSWTVYARRALFFWVSIGYVNASSEAEALSAANGQWPAEKRLRVYLEQSDAGRA